MKIAIAQIESFIGDISCNEQKILREIRKAEDKKANLLIFPEMALTGYPLLDLTYKKHLLKKIKKSISKIHKMLPPFLTVLLGSIKPATPSSNGVFLLQKNKIPAPFFAKEYLADHDVFDEVRYFKKGSLNQNNFFFKHYQIQILICEDIWQNPANLNIHKKTDLIISLNASPYNTGKYKDRIKRAQIWAKKHSCPIIYLNSVGGHEELIFDGGSFILNKNSKIIYQSGFFREDFLTLSFPFRKKVKTLKSVRSLPNIAQALIFGLKEFANKNHFTQVHLGLSGGIDSTLVSYLAVRALGAEKVQLFFMPGPFSSSLSYRNAKKVADKLKCTLHVREISTLYVAILKSQKSLKEISKQNIQARLRNLFLMIYANNNPQSLLLGCANKSELAIGYSTLYGDLTGGLFPIGDLFKTEVYKLSRFFKIPQNIIKRPPTAELKANQLDSDDIPSYSILDPILKKIIEDNISPRSGFEKKIEKQILQNEFKRRQSPPILKIKNRSFDRGWRFLIS